MIARKPAVDRETLKLIKQAVLEEAEKQGVKVERVILFGSRARGDYREDSDYDILVIVKGELDRTSRRKLARRIRLRLLEELNAPADIIITTTTKWKTYQDEIGHLYYDAKREGILA